ncbi:MAG: monofunctional biosynthetic peptidoglycan transglycosylase [Rhizobiaceae bacterium]
MRRLIKWFFVFLVLVALTPFVLMLAYAPSTVHPVSTLMITKWLSGAPAKRQWVALEDISPFVYQSVVSSEDGQFCAHNGVDWNAIDLVVDDLIEGERPRGASTIPMQTVKNLFLWNSRSYVRKALELPLALAADWAWSKRRMMEIYLNIAEWGPGIFGIEAAARHHFRKSAKKLTRRQAALLAVSLPNPILRNPRKPSRGLLRLARLVEKRARQSGAYVKCLR